MYKCKQCGNARFFIELKNTASQIICTDEGVPMPIVSQDFDLDIVEIYCDVCKASTEDNLILDDENNIIDLSQQAIPEQWIFEKINRERKS